MITALAGCLFLAFMFSLGCCCPSSIDSGGCCYNPDAAHDTIHAHYQVTFPSGFSDANCSGCSVLDGATAVLSQATPGQALFTGTIGGFTIELRLCTVTVDYLFAACGSGSIGSNGAGPDAALNPDCGIPDGTPPGTTTIMISTSIFFAGCIISTPANATITAL